MKKLSILLILTSILTINVKAQTFEANFLGEDYLQYKGVYLKLKDGNYASGLMGTFYSDLKYCQKVIDKNVLYSKGGSSYSSNEDSLINRIFFVETIVDKNGATIENSSYLTKPILVLKDTLNKQIIYFKYDKNYKHKFPFLTSKIRLDKDAFCKKIKRKVDDFTDDITINSPLIDNRNISSMIIYKTISKGKVIYNLRLKTFGSTVIVDGTGAIILFEDGTKITKPVKIDVEADTKGFEYSAFLPLTQNDLEILSSKKVKKFRLYIYDETVNPVFAAKFKIYIDCIQETK